MSFRSKLLLGMMVPLGLLIVQIFAVNKYIRASQSAVEFIVSAHTVIEADFKATELIAELRTDVKRLPSRYVSDPKQAEQGANVLEALWVKLEQLIAFIGKSDASQKVPPSVAAAMMHAFTEASNEFELTTQITQSEEANLDELFKRAIYIDNSLESLSEALNDMAIELRKLQETAVDHERKIHKHPAQAGLIIGGLAALLLLLFAWFFATKSFRPVSDLMAGADRVAQGVLTQPVPVRSGDELGVLAKSFNAMANELQSSYTNLEQKIDERTRELARSVEELKALGKISQAVNSTLDLEEVLSAIVEQAVGLSEADGGAIYQFIDQSNTLELRAASQLDETLVEVLRDSPLKMDEGAMSQSISLREPVQLTSASDVQLFHNLVTVRSALESSGIQALLVLPLMNKNQPVGGLIVARRAAGNYTPKIVALLESFAMQSAIAIQNARLYNQLWEKSTELELASQHKSQFLANMSHELRTPLNAIIGYTELVQDSIYGDVPDKVHEVLERVHKNGQHLLGLINSVLDLSKIEAGLFTLQLEEYSMPDIIRNALATVESLAAEKQLKLITDIEPELPMGKGDEQRLLQVLLNLVGNAIKFTNTGEVSVNAMLKDELFYVAISDTGPGIGEEDQLAIFDEFQQVDNSSTREQGGTGLGLAITKKIILMHGGEIGVHSSIGNGSTFWFRIPLQVNHQREAA